jgi:deazaflavin-dependent oxidoreductase (nitroreductase family)
MDRDVDRALASDLVIDMTTTGRKSGEPRTVEIWFHRVDGRYYITGWPGSRGWYANLLVDPRLVIHFKDAATPDLQAVAHPITDPDLRRRVLDQVFEIEGGAARGDFGSWLASSPIIEFTPAD